MATAVLMPKLGNTVESSVIVAWKKAIGESVTAGDVLCEVETDKATVEVESTASGTLLALFFAVGDDVPVLTPIAAIGAPGEDISGLSPNGADAQTPIQSSSSVRQATATLEATTPIVASPTGAITIGVSPRARRLAERRSVSLDGLKGGGPGGRIIERDVLAALAAKPVLTPVARNMVGQGEFVAPERGGRITKKDLIPADVQAASTTSGVAEEVETVPVKGIRKVIAERMLASLQTTAQLTLNTSADARALLAYRQRLKNSAESFGLQGVTLNDLILFAVSRSLIQFPDLNALFEGEAISRYKSVHLGFAVDTPRGLMVPVIRHAHRLSLKQLSQEAKRLAAACLEGRAVPDDLSGGTFTVSNLGALGIENFTPVLNPPQVGILGVGNVTLKPVEVNNHIEHIAHIGLSLTVNHQVVDGAPGARFLQGLSQAIANVELLLAL